MYRVLKSEIGDCGKFTIADASVAVPFVGAAAGALAAAQLIRLASMTGATAVLRLELGAPGMVIDGGQAAGPEVNLGGEVINLAACRTDTNRH